MTTPKKAKIHISIPIEWKRFLVNTVKQFNAAAGVASGKHTQETVTVKAFSLLRDSIEESGPPKIVPRAS